MTQFAVGSRTHQNHVRNIVGDIQKKNEILSKRKFFIKTKYINNLIKIYTWEKDNKKFSGTGWWKLWGILPRKEFGK